MHNFKASLFVAATVYCSCTATSPNIVLLMADQMRWDTLGPDNAYGLELGNLTWLWKTGAYFRNGYSTTPTCTPARSALLTGLSPWYHGMLGYGDIAQRYPFEWPRVLSQAGYTTIARGKNHFMWNASDNDGYGHGFQQLALYDGLGNGVNATDGEFDHYDMWFQGQLPGENPLTTAGDNGVPLDWNSWRGAPQGYAYDESLHPTAWVAAQAEADIHSLAGSSTPFALKVSFHRPHSPYDPPARVLNATPASVLPPIARGSSASAWDWKYKSSPGCGPSDPDSWCGQMPPAEEEVSRRSYYASLRFVDEGVGRVLRALNDTGLMDKTIVLFLSDHGDGQGGHYLWRKGYPTENSAHVPMLMRWPEGWPAAVPRGTVLDAVTELRDIAPTVLDLAGVPVPQGTVLNGSSLACLVKSSGGTGAGCGPGGSEWRDWIDLEHDIVFNNSIHWSAATDGRTKYIFWALTSSEMLFDLTTDPLEMTDVSGQPAYGPVLATWRARLVDQYTREGRGSGFVVGGRLVPRPTSTLYSPNYPGDPALPPRTAR